MTSATTKSSGTYAANARKSSSAGWGEIVPFPDDEFDAETASSHVAVSIAANEGQEVWPARCKLVFVCEHVRMQIQDVAQAHIFRDHLLTR